MLIFILNLFSNKKYSFIILFFSLFSVNAYSEIEKNIEIKKERNFISIVGSSNIYTFSVVVAKYFLEGNNFSKPKIESTGSGRGIRFFCEGKGLEYPDIVNVSRQLKTDEIENCKNNGVNDPIEILIGYGGIVLASSKSNENIKLNLVDVFMALAQNIPDSSSNGVIVNPHKTWNSFNSKLPNIPIKLFGPPKSSGTYDAFISLALEKGCRTLNWTKNILLKIQHAKTVENKLDEKKLTEKYKSVCKIIRKDGIYVHLPENSPQILKELEGNNIIALVSFSFFKKNNSVMNAVRINNYLPSLTTISNRKYLISSPLYMYVKREHLSPSFAISSIKDYLIKFTEDKAWGNQGYLIDYGLIPPQNRKNIVFGSNNSIVTK